MAADHVQQGADFDSDSQGLDGFHGTQCIRLARNTRNSRKTSADESCTLQGLEVLSVPGLQTASTPAWRQDQTGALPDV